MPTFCFFCLCTCFLIPKLRCGPDTSPEEPLVEANHPPPGQGVLDAPEVAREELPDQGEVGGRRVGAQVADQRLVRVERP